MITVLPFSARLQPDFYRTGAAHPLPCGWIVPGARCRVWGEPAKIIRKSILPDRVWVRRDGRPRIEPISLAVVLPDRAEFCVSAADVCPGSEGYLADPSVVLS